MAAFSRRLGARLHSLSMAPPLLLLLLLLLQPQVFAFKCHTSGIGAPAAIPLTDGLVLHWGGDPQGTVAIAALMAKVGGKVQKNGKWMAMGFSSDGKMNGDVIVYDIVGNAFHAYTVTSKAAAGFATSPLVDHIQQFSSTIALGMGVFRNNTDGGTVTFSAQQHMIWAWGTTAWSTSAGHTTKNRGSMDIDFTCIGVPQKKTVCTTFLIFFKQCHQVTLPGLI